jgi:hypothetical protein
MPDHLDAVDPDGGVVVDGLEVQHGVVAGPVGGDRHRRPVPDRLEEVDVLDPGQLALRGERHGDPLQQVAVADAALQPGVGPVELELPLTVEVEPSGTGELRPGMLGAGLRAGHREGSQEQKGCGRARLYNDGIGAAIDLSTGPRTAPTHKAAVLGQEHAHARSTGCHQLRFVSGGGPA